MLNVCTHCACWIFILNVHTGLFVLVCIWDICNKCILCINLYSVCMLGVYIHCACWMFKLSVRDSCVSLLLEYIQVKYARKGRCPKMACHSDFCPTWKRISAESSVMSLRRPTRSRDWTELNWYLRTGRMFYRITFPDSLEDCAVLSESLSTSSEADVTTCSRRLMQLRGLPMCGRFLCSEVGGRKVADSSRCNKVRSGKRNLTRGTCGSSLINPSAYGSNGNVGYESWPRQKI